MASLFIGTCKYRCKYPKYTNAYYELTEWIILIETSISIDFLKKFNLELKRICNISKDVKCVYFCICEEHFEHKHFTNMSKNKLNWNAISLESAISCVSSNIQSEVSLTSEHENIRCTFPLMNVNKNVECKASPMSADDINYNEATFSTIYDTSCRTLQTSFNISSYPAVILNSDFASSLITQSTDLTKNHESDTEIKLK